MAQDFAKKFYNSKRWERCRRSFLLSKFYVCNRCGKPGDIVHHKILLTQDNINNIDITLSWRNLECMCQSCHNLEHNPSCDEIVNPGLSFNSFGQLVSNRECPPKKIGGV